MKNKKKYNPDKFMDRLMRTARFEHFDTFGEEEGYKYVHLTLKTQVGRIYLDDKRHKNFIAKLMNRRFKWRVTVIVRCFYEQTYIEERVIEVDQPVQLNELEEIVERFREDALSAVNSRHITKVGWIAEVTE